METSDGSTREMVNRLVAAEIGVDAVIPAHEQGLEDYFLGLTQSSDVDSGGARRRGGRCAMKLLRLELTKLSPRSAATSAGAACSPCRCS